MIFRRVRPFRRLLVWALLAAVPGWAAAAAPLSAADRADVARVERYLNTIRSIRARFVQTASTGSFAEGRLYLARPGRLRLDYTRPPTMQVFADGTWLIYVDTELEEVSQVPLSATPAAVLVADKVRLAGAVKVTGVARGRGVLSIRLVQTDAPDSGTLVLTLGDRPLSLRRWTVIDAQGVRTRVALVNPEFNVPIAPALFRFEVPVWARPPED